MSRQYTDWLKDKELANEKSRRFVVKVFAALDKFIYLTCDLRHNYHKGIY